MSAYTEPIFVAALVFLGLFFATFLPWLIYTYRKYGFLSFSKTIIVFSFIFYFLSALFLVLLPLPETTNTCAIQRPGTQFYNVRPFQFVQDILRDSGIVLGQPTSWLLLIKQPAFYQAFFNFLLLMPFGVYLRYFLKERQFWKRAFFIGLGLTLFYEITQVTGIYGIYNCPYRIFDVDDLLLNSTGALLGFLVAPVVLSLLPTHKDVLEKAQQLQQQNIVKPLHILVALVIDMLMIELISGVVTQEQLVMSFIVKTALYVVSFVLIPLTLHGATLGMKLLRIKMVDEQTYVFNQRGIVRRFVALYAVFFTQTVLQIMNRIELNMDSSFYVFQIIVTLVSFGFALLFMIVLAIHIIRVLLAGGNRRFFFDEIGRLVASREKR